MPDTMTIPVGGYYIEQNGMRWHLSISGKNIVVRLVELERFGTPNLCVAMPAGNVVRIFPEPPKDT